MSLNNLNNLNNNGKKMIKEHESYSESYSDSDSESSNDYRTEDHEDFKGELLNNKYLLIHQIGSGSFATVWLSLNTNNNKYHAIKIQDADEYDSGKEEVNLCIKFNNSKCQFINTINEHFEYRDKNGETHVCMVFELLAGSLYDIIRVGKYSHGFPLNIVKSIIKQLLIAMDIVNNKHKILHTDIKPDNILVVGVNNKVKEMIEHFKNDKNINICLNKKKKKDMKKNVEKISFESIEEKYSKYNKNPTDVCFIDDKYIKNIQVKLSDFGNCREINYSDFDIQTLYYRAPEIIVGYKYNENCDMWSVACIIYELLTGEILFNPDKKKKFSRDRHHLYDIICLLGKIPDDILNSSQRRYEFFKTNGLLKGVFTIEYKPLYKLLMEKLTNKEDFNQEQLFLIIDLMYKLLNYNPYLRPKANEILKHKWFENVK